jgi:hypothetical protein
MFSQHKFLDPVGDFLVTTEIETKMILNFEPEESFQEENDLGLGLIIQNSFKESFLCGLETPSMIYPCTIQGLRPKVPIVYDGILIKALGEKINFELAHLFDLLWRAAEGENILLVNEMNYFYILTPEGRRRAFALYLPNQGKWMLGADRINSKVCCRESDQVFTCIS